MSENEMNCKHLKIKINHSLECKKTDKIINIKKCNKTDCKYFEYKETQTCNAKINKTQTKKQMRVKSYKLAKLERNRYSVFTDNKDKCMFCDSTKNLTWHECFSGKNRQRSMKYKFCLRMCLVCHEMYQEDKNFNQYWHNRCREYFLKNYGNLEEFIKVFGKSYIDDS